MGGSTTGPAYGWDPHLEHKRKSGLGDERTFVCLGSNARNVRDILCSWGWVENTDPKSRHFDIKWAMKPSKVDGLLGFLPPTQMVNHFRGSGNLHSKSAFEGHINACPRCSMEIYPRQYDLRSSAQLTAFIDDYILTVAEAVMQDPQADPKAWRSSAKSSSADPDAEPSQTSSVDLEFRHRCAQRIVARAKVRGQDMNVRILRCRHEWKSLLGRSNNLPQFLEARARPFIEKYDAIGGLTCTECDGSLDDFPEAQGNSNGSSDTDPSSFCQRQKSLIGAAAGRAWIVKAPNASRGEGLYVSTDLRKLLEDASSRKSRGQRWNCGIQKYIERCLTLSPDWCKTDFRIWVLVFSWNPVVVFAHAAPYFRVAGKPFTFEGGTEDRHAHLSNRPQQVHENRILLEEFLERLEGDHPGATEIFWQSTWPKVLDGIRLAVLATQASVITECEEYRRGKKLPGPRSFELFGFDFAIDADLKPWLLEANVTPDMLPGDPEPMRTWAYDATEGLLKVVTGVQSGELKLPSAADLAAAPEGSEDNPPPDRLLQVSDDDSEHTAYCMRSRVNSIPRGLVSGYEIPNCSPWRLIYIEAAHPERDLLARNNVLKSRKFGMQEQKSHDQVLRHRLLPMPETEKGATSTCPSPGCPSPSLESSPKATFKRRVQSMLSSSSGALRKAAAEGARESETQARAAAPIPPSPEESPSAPQAPAATSIPLTPGEFLSPQAIPAGSHIRELLAVSQARADAQQQQQMQQFQRALSPAMCRRSQPQSPTQSSQAMPLMKGLGIRGMSYSSMRLPPLLPS